METDEGGPKREERQREEKDAGPGYAPVLTLYGHSRSISSLSFSPDGLFLSSASADRTIKIWSIRSGNLIHTLKGHQGGISDLAWSPCSRYIASASDDRSIVVWNAKDGYDVRHLVGHTSYVFCVAYSPQSNLIASGSFDETVRLWDARKGICHRTIAAHSEAVTDVDFNRDGTLIASCSYDGLIRLWDVPTGLCLATLPHPTSSPTTSIRFSPSSSHLLASSLDSALRLWDVAKGKVVKTYRTDKHNGIVEGQMSMPGRDAGDVSRSIFQNEKFAIKSNFLIRESSAGGPPRVCVVTGSEDCKVYIWDLQTRALVAVLAGHHRDVVGAVAVHPSKPILASAALDHDLSIKMYLDQRAAVGAATADASDR
ncbi:unnamed protein product [Parajaminaea phylloscopi]